MPERFLITNALIINEGLSFEGSVLVEDAYIARVEEGSIPFGGRVIDARGKWLIPGVIDDQVHFRDPGLTHKGDLFTESRAAAAGGVTSFMDMPNTNPQTLTREALSNRYELGAARSVVNFSFYMGTSNDNLEEVLYTDPATVCGIKVFMGASTGNMLVDRPESLHKIFASAPCLVAVHCEDENTIRANTALFREKYGEDIPFSAHPEIRNAESCLLSSSLAVDFARELGTRLHVLHLSTAGELALFEGNTPLSEKQITAEVCVHHLYFDHGDYAEKGSLIKWNPAIKSARDREALMQALLDDRLDVVATDHAPHTLAEKARPYLSCPSGAPMVQHSLTLMMDMALGGAFDPSFVVRKMCHAPADCFSVNKRGYIREGYHADLVLVDPLRSQTIDKSSLLYKCAWSPLEGRQFRSVVTDTFVNGSHVYSNGVIDDNHRGMRLTFNR